MLLLLTLIILLSLTLLLLFPLQLLLLGSGNLLSLPGQLLRLFVDERRQRNHALQLATVNVLAGRYGAQLLPAGMVETDGFIVHGPAQPQMVLEAAREGLQRLQAGELRLALHPRSTMTMGSALLIALLAFAGLLLLLRVLSFGTLLLALLGALIIARVLAQPLGAFFQRHLFKRLDLQGMEVTRLDAQHPQHPFALILAAGQPTQFRVWTATTQAEGATPKRYRAY